MLEDDAILDLDEIEKYYKENLNNLKNDIDNIDMKCDRIESHILSLELNINRIESLIQNTQGPDKGKLYAVLNATLSLLNEYHKTQNTFLDLKFKYRKEQNDTRTHIVRMKKIELPKINKEEEVNMSDLIRSLNNLTKSSDSNLTTSVLDELNNNNDYKL
jgi:hypothetical protein